MSDDLLERLRSVDPARDDLVSAQARALGDLPGRIVAGESPVAGSAGRWPRVPRRAIAIGLAAVLVALGVGVPLALLRPLGGEQVAYGPLGDGWFRAGTLTTLQRDEVTYVRAARAFVVAPANEEPFALSSWSPHMPNESLLFCQSSGWFFSPAHGEKFDLHGNYELGPAPSGIGTFPVRLVDGFVDIETQRPAAGAPRGAAGTDPRPSGPFCDGGFHRIRPGVVALAASTPFIVVESPRPGASVTSPVRISGTADAFEATVSYRIIDPDKQVLAQGSTTVSCGSGCRGTFSILVPYTVDRREPGVIQVFETGSRDGTDTDLVNLPVTLLPEAAPSPPPTTPPSGNRFITVTAPLAGATVTSPVTIAGTADIFEAVVSYRILDEHGKVVADGITMASCGGGCRGTFSVRVRFTVDHAQPGTIEVFEVSSKDGSDVNVVEVPVTLSP